MTVLKACSTDVGRSTLVQVAKEELEEPVVVDMDGNGEVDNLALCPGRRDWGTVEAHELSAKHVIVVSNRITAETSTCSRHIEVVDRVVALPSTGGQIF